MHCTEKYIILDPSAYEQPYCKQHVDHEMYYVQTLRMRRINTGVHRVCQIEFTHTTSDLSVGHFHNCCIVSLTPMSAGQTTCVTSAIPSLISLSGLCIAGLESND